ncbi:uridine kinase [Aerococcus urinaeequi]|jgi:uridine kinase|uniref:Uridine kinase n=3 Tax=Aerococcus TaxID=1375 RepID=A0A0U4WTD6_9LACT|nr:MULTISPECIES: uridine kinase [Lactobacillales]KAF3301517.1 uridine kinase [Carnobacterium sp. PL17RED31]ALZ88028.1 uridine kinase [Aerococcus urinaeequi]AMB98171.1 uridine kinase [Aerococcus urinaeequi]AMC00815.1 uridine kinase [Aerococcus viridans]EFG50561.1 uridine kinase [Aerococcus viridans ATCC 11563 = CCUG 4311]
MRKPIIIGVTGGTGSGKTTVTRKIIEEFGDVSLAYIPQDAYYKDQSHLTMDERVLTNYDHPFAFDNDLLSEHIRQLLDGQAVQMPVYDFTQHNRAEETIRVEPKEVIIIEGILIFSDKELRDLMDIKVFVDTDDDIRIIRRIKRDMAERGRSLDSIIDMYTSIVKPMHEQFIEPTKKFADIIIPEGGSNNVAIDLMTTKIRSIIPNDLKID